MNSYFFIKIGKVKEKQRNIFLIFIIGKKRLRYENKLPKFLIKSYIFDQSALKVYIKNNVNVHSLRTLNKISKVVKLVQKFNPL